MQYADRLAAELQNLWKGFQGNEIKCLANTPYNVRYVDESMTPQHELRCLPRVVRNPWRVRNSCNLAEKQVGDQEAGKNNIYGLLLHKIFLC